MKLELLRLSELGLTPMLSGPQADQDQLPVAQTCPLVRLVLVPSPPPRTSSLYPGLSGRTTHISVHSVVLGSAGQSASLLVFPVLVVLRAK